VVPPTLYVQLGERLLERRLDRRHFFRAEVLFHRRPSAGHGFFGRGFVDRAYV